MLTEEEEIANIREYWQHAHDRTIEDVIKVHKGDIEVYQRRIGDKRDFIKVLETILDERYTDDSI